MNYEQDYPGIAKGRVPAQFGPGVKGYAEAWGAVCQLAEDDLFDLYVSQTVDEAQGALLDRWGAIVGEPRGGLGDDDYRRIIRVKLQAQKTGGSPPQMAEVVRALFPDLTELTFREYAAHYRFHVSHTGTLSDDMYRRIMRIYRLMKPAGVGAGMVEGPADVFRFDKSHLDRDRFGRTI